MVQTTLFLKMLYGTNLIVCIQIYEILEIRLESKNLAKGTVSQALRCLWLYISLKLISRASVAYTRT